MTPTWINMCLRTTITIFMLAQLGWTVDPFAQQSRISIENGHLILRAAENRNVTLLTTGDGSVWVNDVDFSNVFRIVKSYLSGSLMHSYNIENLGRTVQDLQNQWSSVSNMESQLIQLEYNVTAISERIDQFIGKGQQAISNRKLRQLIRKVNNLEGQVRQLNQLLSTNECASNPCRNGGTCTDTYNGFLCQCPTNWEGPTCETDVNECSRYAGTSLGCQNGATCYNTPGSYRCECRTNYYGVHCRETHDDCSSASHQELCSHGTCINENRVVAGQPKYRCLCDEGWTSGSNGPACDQDIDECAGIKNSCSKNPPVTCINLPGSFHCGPCPHGYTGNGQVCYDINECDFNNGGCSRSPFVTCLNTVGSRQCGPCPSGYIGDGVQCAFVGVCSVNRGGCHPSATCIENTAMTGTYRECRCPPGYVGNGEGLTGCLQAEGTTCASNPCQHGTCQMTSSFTSSSSSFYCTCYPGYTGALCDQPTNPCFSQPCQNGGTCISHGTTFTCSCTEEFEGATCFDAKQSCGGTISQNNGTLKYPLIRGQEYRHRESCSWIISVENDKVVNITFDEFHLEEGPNCEFDFLQINDGSLAISHPIGRYCGVGTLVGTSIQSTHSEVYVWFNTDRTVAGLGFSLSWTAVDPLCGGYFEAEHGAIKSPGYPGKYPRNRDCYWHVSVRQGQRIQFHFATLQLEHHENCSFDFLKLYDGSRENDFVLGTYCTTVTPPPLMTSTSSALLHFHSDGSVEDTGFQITYAAIPAAHGCGGFLTAPAGTFNSPNFPDVYDNMLTCEWLIRIHPKDRIELTFQNFTTERHRNCGFDYVEVYEGVNDAAPILGRFCGPDIPPKVISSANQLFIKFHTDSSVQFNGFKAKYRTICGGFYTESAGSFTSPYYPEPYPSRVTCYYHITSSIGNIIQLEFPVFFVEGNDACSFDYVQVRDGDSEDSSLLGQYCGEGSPEPITSSFNHLWIKFNSDGSVQNRGFFANYTTISLGCGGVFTENNGMIQTPQHPTFYPPSVTCTWLIKAPAGFVIRLTFHSFVLEHHGECNFDYVQVNDSDGGKLGKYCGEKIPPILTSAENVMIVKFVADSSVSHEGFTASYVFLDSSQFCGGDYYKESGVVRSPKYPDRYQRNMNCVWVLHAENGHQIVLNVSSFHLENHTNCRYDYLEIRNGAFSTSPLVGRYCGLTIPSVLTSHSNVFRLEFKSDALWSAPGFEIFYDSGTTGCGGTLKTPRGSIISPNYPQPYGHNAACFWLIHMSEGSAISVAIIDVDIEEHATCVFDFLEIFDGPTDNSKSLIRLCNNQQYPGPISSSGNTLLVKFRTDMSGSGKGFHLSYQAICNNVLKKRRGIIESPNFPNTYPHNHNCTWTIEAPSGNNISLAFSHLFMENASSCDADYVQILERKHDAAPLQLAKYCGTPFPLPPAVKTSTNVAMVRLVTDSTITREGFRLEYVVKGCGGDLTRSFGVITSPNYPNGYPVQTECYWVIRMDPGKRIELTIKELDLEAETTCRFDYVRVFGGEDENSPRLLQLCHRITQEQTVTSHGNHMAIHFRSDSSVSGRGFRAMYRELPLGCGGSFTAVEATFMSPNYPSAAYNPNDECDWLIKIDQMHLVVLEFYEFSLPQSVNCTNGYVAVYDGRNSSMPLLMRHCGELPANPIISATGNEMLVRLKGDGENAGKGFKAHYKSGCGRHIIADQGGEITSPNYPYSSVQIYNCSWIISASDPGQKVTLVFTKLYVLDDSECTPESNIHIEVRDGDKLDSPIAGRYCGRRVPLPITSQGNSLHISASFHGIFRATFAITSSYCGGIYTSDEGSFASPDFPNNYPMDTECIWTIQASAGNMVQLAFQSFYLEDSDHCNMDYVEIHERDASGPLVGRYCGNRIPSNVTTAHKMWIKFRSDSLGTAAGFLAHYSLVHGLQLNGTEGVIESPGYPHTFYHSEQQYDWTITVPLPYLISVQFLLLDIQPGHGAVCYTSLQIYDGFDETAPLLGEYCGYQPQEPVVSHSSQVMVRFRASGSLYGKWKLRWSTIDASSVVITPPENDTGTTCWQHIILNSSDPVEIASQGYPAPYPINMNCTWIISVPYFNHVKVKFDNVHLEGDENSCNFDKVQIYTARFSYVDSWDLNATLCGRISDYVVESPSNLMKVVFITDGFYSLEGFHATVEPACGGLVYGSTGYLKSSDLVPYMSEMQAKRTRFVCEWLITVGTRRTIQISFDQFNMPADDSCSNMNIMILNGARQESPPLGVGRYCGTSIPVVPETSSNQALVKLNINSFSRGAPQFNLRFTEISVGCGGHLYLDEITRSVEIATPNYPHSPPHPMECTWIIMSPSGTRMRLDFVDDLHLSGQCYEGDNLEYIEARDGGTEEADLLRRYCFEGHASSTMTTGNALYLTYLTQSASHENGGFKAVVQTAVCGGTIASAFYGRIVSPNYPADYDNSMECEWIIKVQPVYALSLDLMSLDTPRSTNCSLTDYLEIREGNKQGELKALFCGATSDVRVPSVNLAGNIAYIRFKSDSSRTGKGFALRYKTKDVCDGAGQINLPSGVLTSPNFPEALNFPRQCVWRIMAPEGRVVTLTFDHFNLPKDEVTGVCLSSLTVFNMLNTHALSQNGLQLCGNEIPSPIDTTTGIAFLQFSTHGFGAGEGFSLTFTTDKESICGGLLPIPNGTLSLPKFTFVNGTFIDCKWRVETGVENHTVAFRFDFFDIPGHMANYCSDAAVSFYQTSGYFLGRFCGNMTNREPLVTSPYPDTTIGFYASLAVPFLGLRAMYHLYECGGVVSGYDAVITSPGYPNNYPINFYCHWILQVGYGERIKLTTVDMRLEENCKKDYVEIQNGYHLLSPDLGKFCGAHIPGPIISDYNRVSIIFHSDHEGTAPGFKITTSEIESGCGGLIQMKKGIITSPNYPGMYGNNEECVWTFQLTSGYLVNITFIDRFDLEMDTTCSKDYILIEDYDDDSWHEIGKKCGRSNPGSFVSRTTKMRVTFHSNAEIQGDGFKIEYSAVCGGHFTDKSGIIISPDYPEMYANNLYCKYVIGDPQHYLRLSFDPDTFSLETHPECIYDSVTIYEGNTTGGVNRGKFCSTQVPEPLMIPGQVLLEFKTDSSYSGHGFMAEYEISDCGGILTQPYGIIRSIYNPEEYLNNMECTWTIFGQENRIIALRFLYFDLETAYNCIFDSVKIYDGNSTDSPVIATLCGDQVPPIIKSSGSRMVVKFQSDSSVTKKGFQLTYYNAFGVPQGCGGTIISPSGEFKSLDFDKDGKYEPNLDCTWQLIGADDQVIKVTFEQFDVEASANATCKYDYVEVRNGIFPQDAVIRRYCGNTVPAPITTSNNKVSVTFHSDGRENRVGFRATFTSVPSICGPTVLNVTNITKTLTSPNYPSSYPSGLFCRWHFILSDTYTKSVHLSFAEMDVPCGGDYIEVHGEDVSDLQTIYTPYRLCGPIHPHDVSSRYGLWMSFHSDSAVSGKGFSATYRLKECNETYTKEFGVIMAPWAPSYYGAGEKCIMHIETSPGRTIALYFGKFYTYVEEQDVTCQKTSLKVHDGESSSAPLIAVLCGPSLPNPIFSTGHQLFLDATIDYMAFTYYISYTTTNKGRGCGGKLSHLNGTFSSPLYPFAYNISSECQWQLSVPGEHTMTLRFDFFSLSSSSGCEMNYVEIYDGTEDTISNRVIRLCGEDIPAPYNSQGSQLLVKLVTNSTNTAPGFLAHFSMDVVGKSEPSSFVIQPVDYQNTEPIYLSGQPGQHMGMS